MSWHIGRRNRWRGSARDVVGLALVGLVAGGLAGVATISTIASAQSAGAPRAVLDVTHSPPLLTVAREPRRLGYDTYCLPADVESPDERCTVVGTLHVRAPGEASFRQIAFEPAGGVRSHLEADLPADLDGAPALEYYAVFRSPDVEMPVTVPAGGASAPSVSRRLEHPVDVHLGTHAFGGARRSGERAVFARWGNGPTEVGLEGGRSGDPIGASAFDVDSSGSIALLDHVHRRLLRWSERGPSAATRTPLSINGTIADLALAGDGSFYVLETTSRDGRPPLVRRFDDAGRELEAVESGERGPAQIRIGPDGPIVLQRPSHQWMPVAVGGVAAAPTAQRQQGRDGRLLRAGGEVVLLRQGNELRVALLADERILRSWRITSSTSLGEVQLAEPLGSRFVVVVRVYDDRSDEFVVVVLDRHGLVSQTTLDSAEWAQTAPLGRFRLVGRTLYRLGSSPAGAFVDRFGLEVR